MAVKAFIHPVIQYCNDSRPERQAEYDDCVRRNLDNPWIAGVHGLVEPNTEVPNWLANHAKYRERRIVLCLSRHEYGGEGAAYLDPALAKVAFGHFRGEGDSPLVGDHRGFALAQLMQGIAQIVMKDRHSGPSLDGLADQPGRLAQAARIITGDADFDQLPSLKDPRIGLFLLCRLIWCVHGERGYITEP